MATGMVLVIVMRQIDLSVGSMLSFVAVAIGVAAGLQLGPAARRRPSRDLDHRRRLRHCARRRHRLPSTATSSPIASIPSFIVTLGGLIVYRGVAFCIASGETVAPMDKTFKLIGGTVRSASIGPFWSWVLARRRLRRHRLRPSATAAGSACASTFRCGRSGPKCFLAVIGSVVVLGATCGGEFLSLAAKVDRAICHGQQHPHSAGHRGQGWRGHLHGRRQDRALRRRPELLHRLCHSGADALAVGLRHDLHRHAHALRPLCLRHRRQSGSRRTRRHQHQADDRDGLRADGRPGRRSRPSSRRPASTPRPTRWARSTSST